MPKHCEALLFPTGVTSIEVRCWSCGHTVELTPDKLPSGITRHDFERRAKCKCGKSRDGRDELQTIMDFIQEGDTLVVCKLDRLGRSTRDVLNLVYELEVKGASLKVLEPEIDTSGPMGKMILTVLGMVGEMELNHLKERQKTGIEAAKAKGVYKGRPVRLDHSQIRQMHHDGMKVSAIAAKIGCSRGAVYKVLGS